MTLRQGCVGGRRLPRANRARHSCSNRPRAADVVRVARAGELMPQKSTYFSPKPATGLLVRAGRVVRPMDRDLEAPIELIRRPAERSARHAPRAQGRDRSARPRHPHRVLAARAADAPQAAPARPRRAGRLLGLAPLPGVLRPARLGGARRQPARSLLVGHSRLRDARFRDLRRRRRSPPRERLGGEVVVVGHGYGALGCAQGSRAQRGHRTRAHQPSPAVRAATSGQAPQLRAVPEIYRRDRGRLGRPARGDPPAQPGPHQWPTCFASST